MQVHDMADGEK